LALAHGDDARINIEVADLQSRQLAVAHPRFQRSASQRAKDRIGRVEQSSTLIDGEELRASLLGAFERLHAQPGVVAAHLSVREGAVQRRSQQSVHPVGGTPPLTDCLVITRSLLVLLLAPPARAPASWRLC